MNTKENITTKEDEKVEENVCGLTGEYEYTEEGTLAEDQDVINDITTILEDPDCAYPLNEVIDGLISLGHENPGKILTLALQDDVIYVDSIDNDGVVYIALVEQDEEE